jgi:predicted RNA-binding protein with RPS1 domain
MTDPASPESQADHADQAAHASPVTTPHGAVPEEGAPHAAADETPAAADASGQAQRRRIAIGTQRSGVKPPSLAPQYRYVGGSTPAAADSSVMPPAAVGDAPTSAAPDATRPASAAQTLPQPTAPRNDGPSAPQTPPSAGDTGGPSGRARGRRGRDAPQRPSPADVLPPAKRVAVPSVRGALDDDLEADYEAALAGLEVGQLLDASADRRIEAPLEPGTRLTGTILSVGGDTAFIDLGGRRQGAMKLAGWLEEGHDLPEVGQTIDVAVGGRNADDNLYDVTPANRAMAVEDWTQLEAGMVVAARVTAANKGGLECDVGGLRGFMPASLVSTWRIENLEEMVGQSVEALVTELVPAARRLVLSRRAVIERRAADARTKLLESLEPGTPLDGIVRSVRDFGAFVDIGDGVEGLVHASELSWERVANPADVIKPGDAIRVVVKKVDRQTGKIGLSAKDLVESPWKRAADRYHVGATVRGAVTRIAQFGAFVRLEPGIEGLVHVSELATRHVRSVADVVREGAQVECRVLAIDPEGQRLSLSIKALAPVPAAVGGDAGQRETDDEPVPPPAPVKKRMAPLKGGLGGGSAGGKFGLTW